MFHAIYVGSELPSLSINVKANGPAEPIIPMMLHPNIPGSINFDSAVSIQIQWGVLWLDFMTPVYLPTTVPGTEGRLKMVWSQDNQLVVLMDEATSS